MEMEVDKFLGRTYLGALCINNHDNGNGLSARYTGCRSCITCHKQRNASRRRSTKALHQNEYLQQIAFNRKQAQEKGDTTYLGGVCKRGHDEGGGFSRRYTLDKDCTTCRRNGKRVGGSRDDSPILRPKAPKEGKPKSESKPKEPKKKEFRLAKVPRYVSPTINQEKIDAEYRQRMADMKRLEYQMKREGQL